jgi:hypothetical protein
MNRRVENRPMGLRATVPLLVFLFVAACGSRTDEGAVAANSTTQASACTWPSTLDGDPSSRTTCHAARRFLDCNVSSDLVESCTTDGAPACPESGSTPCKDRCSADEYVVSCGGVGPGPVPDPPASCRAAGAVPAGIAYYCCPCGS